VRVEVPRRRRSSPQRRLIMVPLWRGEPCGVDARVIAVLRSGLVLRY
jgi:hypothetical protein